MEPASTVRAHQLKPDGTLGIVIPKNLREKLNIVKGTEILVMSDSKTITLQPMDTLRRRSGAIEPDEK
jgi:AbrB family looped-hinge helix DNA binding protein